jgi:hypothetical protein|tara:strand:- start:2462 stop:3253 length:792 start_codon:yes stop_codon:yes gene_type:complete
MRSPAKLSQRWTSSADDSLGEASTPRRLREEGPLIVWKRLRVECLVLLLLISWGVTMSVVVSSRFSHCRTSGPLQHIDRFVNFQTQHAIEGGHWTVDANGLLAVSSVTLHNASWAIEWQPELKGWFCLRWLQRGGSELRLLEAAGSSGEMPWVLRTGTYGCRKDAQLFKFRGRSLFSKGTGSFVNLRARRHLRTHGDTQPWRPLLRETRLTYLIIDAFPELPVDTQAYERRLLDLIAAREDSAVRRPREEGNAAKNRSSAASA